MPVWLAVALIVAFLIAGAIGLVLEWRKPKGDPDRAVLDQLQKAGSNLATSHQVEFFLLFSKQEQAQAAAQALSNTGYVTTAEATGVESSWLCKATKSLVPEVQALRRIRADLSRTAARFGGAYDGWGAGVVK